MREPLLSFYIPARRRRRPFRAYVSLPSFSFDPACYSRVSASSSSSSAVLRGSSKLIYTGRGAAAAAAARGKRTAIKKNELRVYSVLSLMGNNIEARVYSVFSTQTPPASFASSFNYALSGDDNLYFQSCGIFQGMLMLCFMGLRWEK